MSYKSDEQRAYEQLFGEHLSGSADEEEMKKWIKENPTISVLFLTCLPILLISLTAAAIAYFAFGIIFLINDKGICYDGNIFQISFIVSLCCL